jgi:Uma2 family endonuclease
MMITTLKSITSLEQLDLTQVYSYAEYLSWVFQERVELIKGKIFPMAAPRRKHQAILGNLYSDIRQFVKLKICKVYLAPFDVRLYDSKKFSKANKDIFTVVQPDLCVICDQSKLDDLGCIGTPDLVVEILSPSNSKHEMKTKYELYEEVGVLEYWVVDPEHEMLHQFVLDNEKYQLRKIYMSDEVLVAAIFPELKINLPEIFQD